MGNFRGGLGSLFPQPGEQPGVLGSANQKSGKKIITPPSKTHIRSSRSTTHEEEIMETQEGVALIMKTLLS